MVYGKGANDGSKDHEEQDAKTFASWGVTYLKNDICGGAGNRFVDMRNALNKTGVPMYYSIHGPTRVPTLANSWRTTRDINNNWLSIIDRAVLNDGFADAAQPGAFNDPDMLEVGNLWNPLGVAEGRSQMSMWSVMKAPLMLGTDVTNMTAETVTTLTNPEVIRLNQDSLGIQAKLLGHNSSVYSRPVSPDRELGAADNSNATAWAWAVQSPRSVPSDSAWSVQPDGRLTHPSPTASAAGAAGNTAELCLTAPDARGVADKQPLSVQPCTSDLAVRQQFSFGNNSSGGRNLVLKSSGSCVAMKAGLGPALIMFACTTGFNEEFQLSPPDSSGSGGSTLCSGTMRGDRPMCVTVESARPGGARPPPPPHHGPSPPLPPGGGSRVSPTDPLLTWVGELEGGAHVALLVNNLENATTLHFHVGNITSTATAMPAGQRYSVRDLWKRANIGMFGAGDVMTFPAVGGHDCVLLRFQPEEHEESAL